MFLIRASSQRVAEPVKLVIQELGLEAKVMRKIPRESKENYRVAIVIGGDREVLDAFHEIAEADLPVLGVRESSTNGFLTEVGMDQVREAITSLIDGKATIEENIRLKIEVDGRIMPPILNEVALFSSKSATIVGYSLKVDDELIWRDQADGLIVSTPLGSSAYALSAGGPMVSHAAKVMVIVPVNSLDTTRRPLIVPDTSQVSIEEISSRVICEVILDGTIRARVKEFIDVSKHPVPARLVRLPGMQRLREKIVKKVKLAEELLNLPPSTKLIIKTLEYEGPLTQRELAKKTMLPDRTMRQALAVLVEKGMIKRRPLLRDARQKVYYIA